MLDRRKLLALLSAGAAMGVLSDAFAAPLRLVFVHGRGQQGQDPALLKAAWLDALKQGAQKVGAPLPSGLDVAFPYYGDALDRFTQDFATASEAHARGGNVSDQFLLFQAAVADELRLRAGVSDAELDAEYGPNPKPKGPLNWEWVHAILRTLDRRGGGMGQAALETFTRDVFLYLNRVVVRDEINRIVAGELTEAPTVVVGHSLGSVVAYNVLRSDQRGLRVPLYLTVGCPLGIRAIRDNLVPLRFPQPVGAWYNAFDTRDVVALYPLDGANFPVTPAIENYGMVDNQTDNRHGIAGYLDDVFVAKRILDAVGR